MMTAPVHAIRPIPRQPTFSASHPYGFLTESEVNEARLHPTHRDFIILHLHRLRLRVRRSHDDTAEIALARMTVVFRAHLSEFDAQQLSIDDDHDNDNDDEYSGMEFRVQEIVEAGLSTSTAFAQPAVLIRQEEEVGRVLKEERRRRPQGVEARWSGIVIGSDASRWSERGRQRLR